ncbi:uncharacterized protein LOC117182962 [Belonocnema kinseyi]|uniref:uncharacterized protein LOC117182962 n=1 Tax=Belonocnema kinseyi TaxID=2817044 RepID=UPI00143D06D9|nr:uncharacterized protein LOC117182962 [Belonocnema kinseyi]
MNWKVAFLLLLMIDAVFSYFPVFVGMFHYFYHLYDCINTCDLTEDVAEEHLLCAKYGFTKVSLDNKKFNCMKYMCADGYKMRFLYMGKCGRPIPSTGHISTEPKTPPTDVQLAYLYHANGRRRSLHSSAA